MKKLSSSLLLLFTVVFVLLSAESARANRAAAGEIAYKWVSDSTYTITYTLYKDCAGATPEPTTVNLCYYNTCNVDRGNISLVKKTPVGSNGQPLSEVCSGVSSTTCSLPAGTISGYRKWVYEGTLILPSKCDSWHFVVSLAFRNAGITNYTVPPAANNLYTETTLNTIDAPTSSSPTFPLDPIQYMCSGTKQHFSYSGVDADGDVLTYTLIDPASAADNQTTCTFPPTPTSYVFAGGPLGGTSLATAPFAVTGGPFNLDNTTGIMSFTPNGVQKPQLAMLVTKRRGTKIVGTVIREMQFVVNPPCGGAGSSFVIDIPGSSGVLSVPPTPGVIVCPNAAHRINFRINATPGSTINNVSDDHTSFSPTAGTSTMSAYTGLGTNSVSANFDWTPNETDEGQRYIVVKSEICQPGAPKLYRVDSIPIYVTLTVKIKAKDTMVCFGETTTLCVRPNNIAGTTFDWGTTISNTGRPLTTVGFSSAVDSCTDVTFASTTSVLITTSLPSYCNRTDYPALTTNQAEIKIVVVNPKINFGPDTVMCTYSQLQLNANLLNPQPELTYSYKWRPLAGGPLLPGGPLGYISDTTIPNPIYKIPAFSSGVPDSVQYLILVIPNERPSCAVQDTGIIHIIKGFYILTGDQLGSNTGLGHLGRQKGVSDTSICDGKFIAVEGWG